MEKIHRILIWNRKVAAIFFFTLFILFVLTTKFHNISAQDTSDLQTLMPQNQSPLPTDSKLPVLPVITQAIQAIDARSRLIDDLYERYRTPMQGLGPDIVAAADKFGLPFNLLPAISFCESTGGKVMPQGSFNAWGWYIYGSNSKAFSSWQEAIETISKGLKENYLDKGLTTPEEIMTRYTPSSNGSWAKCVNEYIAQMQ